ncbi:MAG: 5'/3'-nucleotidase SurE [Wolinella sp.]
MKRILITNDDGFDSPGLAALKEALSPIAQLTVVAPANEKSACGHGLTLTQPLRFVKLDDDVYKLVDGTPTDCIYLSLNALYDERTRPNLVISGINLGSNMGEDITYSGTASGAMEGVIHGIPSIAFSQVLRNKDCFGFDFSLAKKVVRELVERIFTGGFPLGTRKFLNVNIPQVGVDDFKGYKITEMGYRLYGNDAHVHRNPRGEEYYWLGLHPLAWEERGSGEESDFRATKNGYVSITPIELNLTSYDDIARLKSWI